MAHRKMGVVVGGAVFRDIRSINIHWELTFLGRKDNQIKLSGQLVVTDEVAQKLQVSSCRLEIDLSF